MPLPFISPANLAYIRSQVKFSKPKHDLIKVIFGTLKFKAEFTTIDLDNIILTKALIIDLNKVARVSEPSYTCAFKAKDALSPEYTSKNEIYFRLASTHPGYWDAEDAIGEFYINLVSGEVEFGMDTY